MATVFEYLVGRGRPFLVLPHPGARTAADTAAAHGVAPSELVRTELVMAAPGPTLMVVPWDRPLELGLVQEALEDPGARLATQGELRRIAPDCDLGALPPLSLYLMAPMFVDPAVASLPQVVFPAGTPEVLVCVEREDLFRDDPYGVVPLTAESSDPERLIAPSRRPLLGDAEDLTPAHLREDDGDGRPVDVA